jgi:hypothetical protein
MKRLALLALVMSSAAARAEAPMVTEHTDPLAVGECEWELFSERQRSDGAKARGWSTNAGCGLLKNLDLGLGIGRWRSEGSTERALELYGRWRLREGGDERASVALVYGLEALKTAGQRWRHDTSTLLLAVDQPLGDALLGRLNLGLSHSRPSRETTRAWALGADWSLGEQFDLVGETYGAQRSKPWQGLGLRWKPLDGWSFGAMASRSTGHRALLFSAQWVH